MDEAIVSLMAESIVEDINAALAHHPPICRWAIRPGKRGDHQQQGQSAQKEQEQIAQAQRTATRLRLIVKKAEGGEFDQVGLRSAAQVQPKRGCNGECAEKGKGGE